MHKNKVQNKNKPTLKEHLQDESSIPIPDASFRGPEVLPNNNILEVNTKKPNLGACTNKQCGRDLLSPYYVFFSPSPVEWIRKCTSIEEEEKKSGSFEMLCT